MKKDLAFSQFSRRSVLFGLGSMAVTGIASAEKVPTPILNPKKKSCKDYGEQVDEFFSEESAKIIFENIVRDVHRRVFADNLQPVLNSVTIYYGRRLKDICAGKVLLGIYSPKYNSVVISPHTDPVKFADTVTHEFLHALETHGKVSCSSFMQTYESIKQELVDNGELLEYYLGIENFIKNHSSYQGLIAAQQEELMVRILADGLFGNLPVSMPKPLVDFYSPLLNNPNLLTDMSACKAFSKQLLTDMVREYKTIENL